MKTIVVFLSLFLTANYILGDEIIWSEQTTSLPNGVVLYKGLRSSPKLQAFYLDVDLNNSGLAVRPYISATSKTVPAFSADAGAYAAVNGGFFGGNTSYSSVLYPGEVKAVNVQTVTRNSQPYPVVRSLFSMDTTGHFSVDWIYHFDSTPQGVYTFDSPMSYIYNDPTPQSAPLMQDGEQYGDLLLGIGGAPTLVKSGQVNVTYNEELMWGSGVGLDNGDPRTAVGYTADNHVILFVADGRQSDVSLGVSLPELAQIMIDLGCTEAMNLDGGGSTQMAVGGNYVNTPSEQRAVPSIFAVVHRDSLGLPKKPLIEKVIDTEDTECELIGTGWFETANSGFWGTTRSMLNGKGDGSAYAKYDPQIEIPANYEVYAWWVASGNRCTDTPFVVKHSAGIDTIRLDQTKNGSSWVKVGTFALTGDSSEALYISNAATSGSYIVADGVRFVTYDTSGISTLNTDWTAQVSRLELRQNYPNPFNSETKITFRVPSNLSASGKLKIFNILGQRVKEFEIDPRSGMTQTIIWDGRNERGSVVPSGIYICQLQAGAFSLSGKMLLAK